MSIQIAPCEWPLAAGLPCSALDDLRVANETLADTVVEMATSHLWNWTGRGFGLCEVTLRPCRSDCHGSTYYGFSGQPGTSPFLPSTGSPWTPALIGGSWYNLTCGSCGDLCSCSRVESIGLPGPIDSVVGVLVDGVAVDLATLRVDDRHRLVRETGEWPVCNDLSKPPTEEGTWQVTYMRGVPVPSGGQVAAALLACELAKAVSGDNSCKLPQRVQTVTREGVSMTILDSFEGLEAGQTGIFLVDSWVMSMTRPPRRPKVYSPDRKAPVATTWRAP